MTEVLSAAQRLRQQMLGGKVASMGAPTEQSQALTGADVDFISGELISPVPAPPTLSEPVLRPGFFSTLQTPPQPLVPPAAPVLSAADKLRSLSTAQDYVRSAKREMASMRTLTRMLEAVFARPGSNATDSERMAALTELTVNATYLGEVIAKIAGDDAQRSSYVRAMGMEAAVGLVSRSWESGRDVNWATLIEASANNDLIMSAAESLAVANTVRYNVIQSDADVADRLAVSMHSAFWQLIEVGESVEGLTPKMAAEIVRDCGLYLQSREKFVIDPSLHVSWMQGSIRRITNLVCAELRARFGDTGIVPTHEDINAVLAVSRSGFEGVENYAQGILEKAHPSDVPRPVAD